MQKNLIPPGGRPTNRMSGQILEDIKALAVNAVMPSFPDDRPTNTYIEIQNPHTHTYSLKHRIEIDMKM